MPSSLGPLVRRAVEAALSRYGEVLEGVAVKLLNGGLAGCRRSVEVYVFVSEVPVEGGGEEMLGLLEGYGCSSLTVATFTVAEAERRRAELRRALRVTMSHSLYHP
ncbi:hypothetical protein B6U99_04785 [Candidatus Geothermarchaeota archaeon ex4572_27]|nr:MAG: hypothetical protein B6U99_04785 [Candidatus Geothermarchaeota archaeon ex4572_27]